MISPHHNTGEGRAVGVKTNGIGERSTAHLNLSRSMAADPEIKRAVRMLKTKRELRIAGGNQ